MNAIVWISLANIVLMCMVLWQIYTSSMLADQLDELLIKNTGRFSTLLEKCLELKDKNKHE